MTKEQSTNILCFIAQEFVSPLCFIENEETKALYNKLSGEKFNELCELVRSAITEG